MAPTLKLRKLKRPESFANNFDYLRFLSEPKREKIRKTAGSARKDALLLSPSVAMHRYIYAIVDKKVLFCHIPTEEYDLEQKMDLEIKMREGTTKLLAVCRHRPQSLEAAKSLLTSDERVSAYTSELQRRKDARRSDPNPGPQPSRARVAVSEIRMPLIWKDTDHFKNKGDYRRFAVFCLLKIGTEIYDTVTVGDVDRSTTDVSLDDVVVFNNVPADFEFRLEVYSHILHDDLSMASTPRKITKKITNSVSRAIGRKLAASLKEELNSFDTGPKFELEAHATLRLSDAADAVKTHDLVLEGTDQHRLPLFGHFCCRLAVLPDCASDDVRSGHLSVLQCPSGVRRLWCVLGGLRLAFWTDPEDVRRLPPVLSIPVNKDTRLGTEGRSSERPHAFRILAFVSEKVQEHLLVADSESDRADWVACVRRHVEDHELWGVAAEKPMEIPSPGVKRVPPFLSARQNSLYDETSLKDSPQGAANRVLQESNRRASPVSLGSRSSSASSTSTGSGRCFAPGKKHLGQF